MAINIFSGQSGKQVNKASQSSRAQAAKQALGNQPSQTSDSGNTAVGSNSTLSKIGNVVGNIAGVASKFLPGVAGTVASGIANLFNDPEWWQSVPGEQITMNVPQRVVNIGTSSVGDIGTQSAYTMRPAITEFSSCDTVDPVATVIEPTEAMITQYLMPEIRKVVNAVPLQSASAYTSVLKSHSTVYALWRQLKRIDFMLKHGTTYIPNLNVASFPICQLENSAYLQSTINRIEEYLRANVRLPHTMCEYLAWRFGRIYKTCDSERAGFVTYNVIPMTYAIAKISEFINNQFAIPTSTDEYQKANADLYNTYYDHDMMVEIRDDTQMKYDAKEFALRTNLDVKRAGENIDSIPVFIDSKLDNPTVFMASTVSTYGGSDDAPTVLFPVKSMHWYIYDKPNSGFDIGRETLVPYLRFDADGWAEVVYESGLYAFAPDEQVDHICKWMLALNLMKATDTYNKNLYLNAYYGVQREEGCYLDVSQLNMDMGTVSGVVLQNEHTFAFANLVNITRKVSQSLASANKEAARDVANMVEKLDIATVGSK